MALPLDRWSLASAAEADNDQENNSGRTARPDLTLFCAFPKRRANLGFVSGRESPFDIIQSSWRLFFQFCCTRSPYGCSLCVLNQFKPIWGEVKKDTALGVASTMMCLRVVEYLVNKRKWNLPFKVTYLLNAQMIYRACLDRGTDNFFRCAFFRLCNLNSYGMI